MRLPSLKTAAALLALSVCLAPQLASSQALREVETQRPGDIELQRPRNKPIPLGTRDDLDAAQGAPRTQPFDIQGAFAPGAGGPSGGALWVSGT